MPDDQMLPKTNIPVRADDERDVVNYVVRLINLADDFRKKFKVDWDEVESQIRQEQPSSWKDKEDWQSKVYIPLQSKTSEIIPAYLKKMLFGTKRNFSIYGTKKEIENMSFPLMEVFEALLDSGKFWFNNDFAMQEACDIGTSFIKMQITPDMEGIEFIWRSCYSCYVDPEARHDFYKSRFWIEEYVEDIATLIDKARNGDNRYDMNEINRLIAEGQISELANSEQDYCRVRGIDGTTILPIRREFEKVTIHEYWGLVKTTKKFYDERTKTEYTRDEWSNRLILIANKKYKIKDVPNPYGFIPVVICRTKKRKYDIYGKGYLENVRGLQDLSNSLVNLGFDSLKISAMDIIVMDDTKVSDEVSIRYEPLAVWKMKDVNAVKFTRTGISAIAEVFRGLSMLDSMYQEATGAMRQLQGAGSSMGTMGDTSDTLGEYQLKMSMIDQRFLDQAKFIENDYFLPLLKKMFLIITNEQLFKQSGIDRILGKAKLVTPIIVDGNPVGIKEEMVSKLDLDTLRKHKTDFEFKVVGLNNFIDKISLLKKIDGLMARAVTNPQFAQFLNMDELITRYLELSEIPDSKDLLLKKSAATPVATNITPPSQINPSVTPNSGQLSPKENAAPPII